MRRVSAQFRRVVFLLTLVSTISASFALTSLRYFAIDTAGGTREEERTLQFPAGVNCGLLLLTQTWIYPGTESSFATAVKRAIGTVHIKVPLRQALMLRLDPKLLFHSEVLEKISAVGIDALQITFMAMDESEDKLCDKALTHLSHFKHLHFLGIDKADASDAGLQNIAAVKDLRAIQIAGTRSTGAYFKALSSLPELQGVLLERESLLQSKNLASLANIPKLSLLELRWCNLDDEGIREISACKHLRYLEVNRNARLTDRCGKYIGRLGSLIGLRADETGIADLAMDSICQIKNLQVLSLNDTKITDESMNSVRKLPQLVELSISGTRITMHGIERLRGLSLEKLTLPRRNYSSGEVTKLRKWFPKCELGLLQPQEESFPLQDLLR